MIHTSDIQREIAMLYARFCGGAEGVAQEMRFGAAVEELLRLKAHRRPRTLSELRSVFNRMMRALPSLRDRALHLIDPREAEDILMQVFATPRQRTKGRMLLHGLFALGCRRSWCWSNPISSLDAPHVEESELHPLSWDELRRLLRVARRPQHRPCMAALGLMLWAGVRPAELERLGWESLLWDESVLLLEARQTKTGGARHVSIYPALASWLSEAGIAQQGPICPPNWSRRWRQLRDEAGLIPWRQDVLRHSFASYHAKMWHDFPRLQAEMGHRSAHLLRTRYLSMRGLKREQVARFWSAGGI